MNIQDLIEWHEQSEKYERKHGEDEAEEFHAEAAALIRKQAAALEAAEAKLRELQEQKPVAWYFEARHIDSTWAPAVTLKHPGAEGVYLRKVTPLYAPQAPAIPADAVYLVASDVEHPERKHQLYERHEGRPPAMCDYEGPLVPAAAIPADVLSVLREAREVIDSEVPDNFRVSAMLAAAPQPPAEPRERVLLMRSAEVGRWIQADGRSISGEYRYATLDSEEA